MAAIVFLNLLIALMNATVQKVDSQRELYWKFTRTGIWADYFDRAASLPPPFTMFNILWSLPYTLLQVGKKARARWSSEEAGKDSPGGSSCGRTDPESARKRLLHARLMMKLIRRTLEDRDDKNAATDAREDKVVLNNAEWEKMKREIAQQVLQSIRDGGGSNT